MVVDVAGEYELEMLFGGAHVPGCPFYVRAYDLSRIRVTDLQDGVVGQETSFKSECISSLFLLATCAKNAGLKLNEK